MQESHHRAFLTSSYKRPRTCDADLLLFCTMTHALLTRIQTQAQQQTQSAFTTLPARMRYTGQLKLHTKLDHDLYSGPMAAGAVSAIDFTIYHIADGPPQPVSQQQTFFVRGEVLNITNPVKLVLSQQRPPVVPLLYCPCLMQILLTTYPTLV